MYTLSFLTFFFYKFQVFDQLQNIIHSMQDELFDSMQHVLAKNIMNLLKLMPSMHSSLCSKKQSSTDKDSSCMHISEAPTVPCGSHSSLQTISTTLAEGKEDKSEGKTGAECSSGQETEHQVVTAEETKPLSEVQRKCNKAPAPVLLTFENTSDELLAEWDKEACANAMVPNFETLLRIIDPIPVSSHLDLPLYTEVLEGMYPQKIEVVGTEAEPTHPFSLLPYVLDEKAFWHRPQSPRDTNLLTSRKLNLFEEQKVFTKVDCSQGPTSSDAIRTTEDITNRNKRTTCMSLNDTADNCVALKKRARMFQNIYELSSNLHHEMPQTLATVSASSHEKDQSSSDANLGQIQQTPVQGTSSATNKDFPWDDPDMVARLIESTDRIEEEWFSQQRQTQYTTSDTQDIHISEIKPNEICCSFSSNPVESAVFNDIVSRIPPHSRQKRYLSNNLLFIVFPFFSSMGMHCLYNKQYFVLFHSSFLFP